jgi:hypothetical protein
MMKSLQAADDLANAEAQLKAAFQARGPLICEATLGFPSGSFKTQVMWFSDLDYWAHFGFPPLEKSPGKRFWNVFGLGKPAGMTNITCEINPPIVGINRRTGGVFASTDSGAVALLHRGRFNVTRGITKEEFREQYRGRWVNVDDDGQPATMIHVTELNDTAACENIRRFVNEVERIKQKARIG